jgi:hypothetical protein
VTLFWLAKLGLWNFRMMRMRMKRMLAHPKSLRLRPEIFLCVTGEICAIALLATKRQNYSLKAFIGWLQT